MYLPMLNLIAVLLVAEEVVHVRQSGGDALPGRHLNRAEGARAA